MATQVALRRALEVPAYSGTWGPAQAERLLWRAGFGPRPGDVDAFVNLGLDGAIAALTHPPQEHWVGPEPHDDAGNPLAPYDASGHDHLGGSTAWCGHPARWSSE